MPRFISTYDLQCEPSKSGAHEEFLKEARLQGWKRWIKIGNFWKRLPETTIVGTFSDVGTSTAAFKTAIRKSKKSGVIKATRALIGPLGAISLVASVPHEIELEEPDF